MHASGLYQSLALLAAAGLSQAQFLINELSFGNDGRIAQNGDTGRLPNFDIQGEPQLPQILSNRIVLTPVASGNQRSSLWSSSTLSRTEWVADVDFRANGPERGGGNLNIWLAQGGSGNVGASSIYTVGKFEGLALVVDNHGNSGGMIRGFLNDGTVDYRHRNVDELAFGHCLYPYRNLGRPSQIKARHGNGGFKVEVDGKLCFESDKISIPTGYNFGVTAAVPDNPDSFEIFKFVVMSEAFNGNNNNYNQQQQQQDQQQDQQRLQQDYASQRKQRINTQAAPAEDVEKLEQVPDEDADRFETSRAQFRDVHDRLQATNHQMNTIHRTVARQAGLHADRHEELKALVLDLSRELGARLDQIEDLNKRMTSLEKSVSGLRADFSRKFTASERNVKGYLTEHHTTLSQAMAESVPGHGRLIAVFVGSQVVLVVGYVLYKRRKATLPKKYL